MKKNFLLILFFITSIVSTSSIAVTNISANKFCNTNDKLIHYDKYSYDPDFTVNFSRYSLNPDFTIEVVDYEFLSDVSIKDNQANQDYSICKSRDGLTIKISEYFYVFSHLFHFFLFHLFL